MAIKRRNEKKLFTQALDEAPKIRCRYCDKKDSCTRRASKERDEERGIITKCLHTPNRPSKKR